MTLRQCIRSFGRPETRVKEGFFSLFEAGAVATSKRALEARASDMSVGLLHSTAVRRAVKRGLSVKYFVADGVADHIKKSKLYTE